MVKSEPSGRLEIETQTLLILKGGDLVAETIGPETSNSKLQAEGCG